MVIFANTATTSNFIGLLLKQKLIDDKISFPLDKREDWRTRYTRYNLQHSWYALLMDDRIREGWTQFKAGADRAGEALFPDRPKETTRPVLPLEKYAGDYLHPAFRELKITVGAPSPALRQSIELWATRPTATWGSIIEFEHITGEYWLAFSYLSSSPTMVQDTGRAEFKIGPNGNVTSFDVEWGPGSSKFTFEKVA